MSKRRNGERMLLGHRGRSWVGATCAQRAIQHPWCWRTWADLARSGCAMMPGRLSPRAHRLRNCAAHRMTDGRGWRGGSSQWSAATQAPFLSVPTTHCVPRQGATSQLQGDTDWGTSTIKVQNLSARAARLQNHNEGKLGNSLGRLKAPVLTACPRSTRQGFHERQQAHVYLVSPRIPQAVEAVQLWINNNFPWGPKGRWGDGPPESLWKVPEVEVTAWYTGLWDSLLGTQAEMLHLM